MNKCYKEQKCQGNQSVELGLCSLRHLCKIWKEQNYAKVDISKNEHQKNKSLHTASEEVKINTLWLEKKKCHETIQPKSEQEGK